MTALYLGLDLFIRTFAQAVHVLIPLHGEQVFFPGVTLLAAGYKIVSDAFTTPGDRNDVIHGQVSRGETAPAVVTNTFGDPAAPPAALADLPRLILLMLYCLLGYFSCEVIHENISARKGAR
jgi:hypothetical protein